MPSQTFDVLNANHKGYLAEIEILRGVLLKNERLMDGQGPDVWMMHELGSAEEKGKELIVVQAPDTVRAGRLKVVC